MLLISTKISIKHRILCFFLLSVFFLPHHMACWILLIVSPTRDHYAFTKEYILLSLKVNISNDCIINHYLSFLGFPEMTTVKQRYRLLGNSLNVHVVAKLIKILCD